MELVFVDECGDDKFKKYFGLSMAVVNAAHYNRIKQGFQSILRACKWNESIEFKGSHLFSATKGDLAVSIEQRIQIASDVLDLNKSSRNARMRFHYARNQKCDDLKKFYLGSLPSLLRKSLQKAKKGRGKDLVAISCDHRDDIEAAEIQEVIQPVLKERGYGLFEVVMTPHSNFETVGILYADLVGYLSARIDTISNDSELFENIPPEQLKNNGKIKKLESSQALIRRVKNLEMYRILEKKEPAPKVRRAADVDSLDPEETTVWEGRTF